MKKLLLATAIALMGCAGLQSKDPIGNLLKHVHPGPIILPQVQPIQPVQLSSHSYQFGTDLPVNCTTTDNMTHCM